MGALEILQWCMSPFSSSMKFPTYSREACRRIGRSADRVRYASMALALERVQRDNIPGALAELGVWRGATSAFIRSQVTQRPFYLFDTFTGFPGKNQPDYRFRNTSVDLVRRRIGDCSDVHFRVGNFPDTTLGLESEVFAFVLIDVDKFESTLAGLRFFYERVPRGGYIFLHDYNSPESERGVSRAVSEFLGRKLEQIVELPDVWGSAVFRKVS